MAIDDSDIKIDWMQNYQNAKNTVTPNINNHLVGFDSMNKRYSSPQKSNEDSRNRGQTDRNDYFKVNSQNDLEFKTGSLNTQRERNPFGDFIGIQDFAHPSESLNEGNLQQIDLKKKCIKKLNLGLDQSKDSLESSNAYDNNSKMVYQTLHRDEDNQLQYSFNNNSNAQNNDIFANNTWKKDSDIDPINYGMNSSSSNFQNANKRSSYYVAKKFADSNIENRLYDPHDNNINQQNSDLLNDKSMKPITKASIDLGISNSQVEKLNDYKNKKEVENINKQKNQLCNSQSNCNYQLNNFYSKKKQILYENFTILLPF